MGIVHGYIDIECPKAGRRMRSVRRASLEKKLPAVSSQESSRYPADSTTRVSPSHCDTE